MVKRLAVWVLGVTMLAGCGVAAGPASVRPAQRPIVKATDVLHQDVVTGFRQIFKTYDVQPKDDKLSFREFGHVVSREWFQQHDTNHDGAILFDEWLTPAELESQVADIQAAGQDLVAKADRDGDHLLTQAEYLAYETFEVDATPWLAGPVDAQIKAHGFQRHANAGGLLGAPAAAEMVGELLALGYYLDDGSTQLRLTGR
ncbi:MAG: hypothetical protein JWM80_4526 [Cyanobacteria bacterium RYN_339]|nr:hypothetical protein [Cyanobacteria bacterium RYN_339]